MSRQIDPAVQERIRALCKQVTVAYDLDAEIQEELYGHMEDKLLAYLAGEERLSSEDAFILVREHFGNPEVLKEILQAVHELGEEQVGERVSLPRRLTAALVVSMVIGIPTGLAWWLAQLGLALWSVYANSPGTVTLVRGIVLVGIPAVALVLSWRILLKWQQELLRGGDLWFCRWPAHRMWVALGLALVVPQFIPEVFVTPAFAQQQFPGESPAGVLSALMIMIALQVLNAIVWLWWADRPPRSGRRLEWAFAGLVALELFQFLCPKSVPCVLLHVNTGEGAGVSDSSLASGPFVDMKLQWSLVWREAEFWSSSGANGAAPHLLNAIAFQFAFIVGVTLLAYGVYTLARRIRRRMARRRTHGQVVA